LRIGVVSDTHMPKKGKALPPALIEGLQSVDLILHAGDWQTLEVYEMFRALAPVEGVAGNVDGDELQAFFGKKKVIRCGSVTIGLVHGDGKGRTTEQRALDAFKGEAIDILVFGHSHIPLLKQHDGLTLYNPGSPTDKRRQPQFSYGLITVEDDDVRVEHVFYDSKT
jgi:uncharacterized protein